MTKPLLPALPDRRPPKRAEASVPALKPEIVEPKTPNSRIIVEEIVAVRVRRVIVENAA